MPGSVDGKRVSVRGKKNAKKEKEALETKPVTQRQRVEPKYFALFAH